MCFKAFEKFFEAVNRNMEQNHRSNGGLFTEGPEAIRACLHGGRVPRLTGLPGSIQPKFPD